MFLKLPIPVQMSWNLHKTYCMPRVCGCGLDVDTVWTFGVDNPHFGVDFPHFWVVWTILNALVWTIHTVALERTFHKPVWTVHTSVWIVHYPVWTRHTGMWTFHTEVWTLHNGVWTVHTPVCIPHPSLDYPHPSVDSSNPSVDSPHSSVDFLNPGSFPMYYMNAV